MKRAATEIPMVDTTETPVKSSKIVPSEDTTTTSESSETVDGACVFSILSEQLNINEKKIPKALRLARRLQYVKKHWSTIPHKNFTTLVFVASGKIGSGKTTTVQMMKKVWEAIGMPWTPIVLSLARPMRDLLEFITGLTVEQTSVPANKVKLIRQLVLDINKTQTKQCVVHFTKEEFSDIIKKIHRFVSGLPSDCGLENATMILQLHKLETILTEELFVEEEVSGHPGWTFRDLAIRDILQILGDRLKTIYGLEMWANMWKRSADIKGSMNNYFVLCDDARLGFEITTCLSTSALQYHVHLTGDPQKIRAALSETQRNHSTEVGLDGLKMPLTRTMYYNTERVKTKKIVMEQLSLMAKSLSGWTKHVLSSIDK